MPEWFDELAEWLRIPSVSADPEHAEDVNAAGSGCATSSVLRAAMRS